jgi:hypothetical protein
VIDGVLGIDVSKDALDVSMSGCNKYARGASLIPLMDDAICLIGWSPRRSNEFTPVWNPQGA